MKGFEYIWRYLKGNRKGKPANRLEREALSDPFLFEALEGLEEVQADHERVVAELELELRPKVVGRKRWKAFRWVAAASILLVGSTAAWLLAGEDDRNLEHVVVVTQGVQADSAVPAVAVVAAAVVPESATVAEKEGEKAKGREDTAVRPKERKVAAYAVKRGEIAGVDAVAVAEADFAGDTAVVAKDSLEMRNSVEGMLEKRLDHVNVREGVSDDKSGVRIRGISPASQQPPRKKPGERREEEVISYDTNKKRNQKPKSAISRATDWNNRKAEGHPTWLQRFERYVADSLRYPEVARVNGMEGEVVLSVRLNKRGNPTRIKVLKELSPECDREAIRLVEFYPGILGNGYTGRIELSVPFRLKNNRR